MRFFGPALLLALLLPPGLFPASASAQAQEQPTPPPPPGQGGDSVLPAGYKAVRWGISAHALQAVLGRGMETAPDTNDHLGWLIDTPPSADGPSRGVVKFRFWDDRLIEVRIFYTGFEANDGKRLVEQFEKKHGPSFHEVMTAPGGGMPPKDRNVQERWTWQDPFTLQILRREIETEAWSCVRQSRVLEDGRAMQEIREREEERERKIREAME